MNSFGIVGVSETSRLNKWQRPRFRGIALVKIQDDFGGMSELGDW